LIAQLVSTLNMASDNKFSYEVHPSIEAKLTVIRINEICTILGYDPNKVPKPVARVCVVHPTVTSTRWNFHVVGLESF
jgi:hypothetical protein